MRHPVRDSSRGIHRYTCNRDDTRLFRRVWTGPDNGEINAQLVSWDSGDWTNDVNSSHPPRPVAVDPDRISFGSCDDEYCARYTIGSPSRTEIQARNANPLIAIEALDEEVEEGEAAQFRLTRLWPEDR